MGIRKEWIVPNAFLHVFMRVLCKLGNGSKALCVWSHLHSAVSDIALLFGAWLYQTVIILHLGPGCCYTGLQLVGELAGILTEIYHVQMCLFYKRLWETHLSFCVLFRWHSVYVPSVISLEFAVNHLGGVIVAPFRHRHWYVQYQLNKMSNVLYDVNLL